MNMSNNEEEAEALKAEGNKLVGKKDWAGAVQKYSSAIAFRPYQGNLLLQSCPCVMKSLMNVFYSRKQPPNVSMLIQLL